MTSSKWIQWVVWRFRDIILVELTLLALTSHAADIRDGYMHTRNSDFGFSIPYTYALKLKLKLVFFILHTTFCLIWWFLKVCKNGWIWGIQIPEISGTQIPIIITNHYTGW